MRICTIVLFVAMAFAASVAKAQTQQTNARQSRPKGGVLTVGYASYYHDRFHGRRTASGEPYHRDSMTCAHLKFPFGTILRVKNTRNGREVDVVVTDRGPYSKKFVIDLSKRAATELGIVGAPFTEVVLTPIGDIHIPFRLKERDSEHVDSLFTIEDTNNTYFLDQ